MTRITVPDTVEDRILALQARKQTLVDAALAAGAGPGSGANRLTMEDLHSLFGFEPARKR